MRCRAHTRRRAAPVELEERNSSPPTLDEEVVFSGTTQMHARCRGIDWSKTSVGPVEEWPPSLRTASRLCLDSALPMAIWAGPESLLIYNDEYATALGEARHPRALARPAREVWQEHHPVDDSLTPIREDDGGLVGMLHVFRENRGTATAGASSGQASQAKGEADETPAEEALRDTASYLDFVLDAFGAADFEMDLRTGTIKGSRRLQALYELPADRAPTFADFSERTHPDDRGQLQGLVASAERTGETTFEREFRIRRSSGGYRWVLSRGRVELDSGGRPSRIRGATIDITARKHIETALQDSKKRLAMVLEQLPVGVGVLDEDGRFISSNAVMKAMTKGRILSRDPQLRTRWRAVDQEGRSVPPRQWPAEKALRGEPSEGGLELVSTDDEGREVWMLVSAVPFVSTDGVRSGAIMVARDITERKRFEEHLRESARRKDEYLAMLGHELRNPLAAIRSATEMTKLLAPKDARLQRAQGVLERQSKHMTRLIDGLLEVSRIARGKIELSRAILDVRKVVEAVLQDRAHELEGRALELRTEAPLEPLWVRADQVRLAQVLHNLVGNAVKFTAAPGRIDVILEEDAQDVVMRVRDTGVGIRSEMFERLFEPFQQDTQDIARGAGGLGLGLALAKGLVELHDGRIEVHSEGLGSGSEFVVRLPRSAPASVEAPPAAAGETGARRILIVEDNPDAAAALLDLLETLGHRVSVAQDGSDGLEFLRRNSVDVVLCDIGLPGMSGYDVAEAVRADPALRDLHLVAVTGYGLPEDKARGARAGFDAHLTKPVDLDVLERLLDENERGQPRPRTSP